MKRIPLPLLRRPVGMGICINPTNIQSNRGILSLPSNIRITASRYGHRDHSGRTNPPHAIAGYNQIYPLLVYQKRGRQKANKEKNSRYYLCDWCCSSNWAWKPGRTEESNPWNTPLVITLLWSLFEIVQPKFQEAHHSVVRRAFGWPIWFNIFNNEGMIQRIEITVK